MNENKSPFKPVGIGMPVYNGEQYLEDAIKANLAQTFNDFVLVIADNASTDRTQEICLDYATRDERIHYVRNPVNLGASKNYSCCFEPANCKYFRWSNADDLIEPELVESCYKVLEDDPDTVLVYGKTKLIDENGELLKYYDDNLNLPQDRASDRFLAFRDNVGLSNVLYGLMRRDQLANTALLGNYSGSDINLIGELTLYGKFRELDSYMFSRRMHAQASSWDLEDKDKQKEFWDPSKSKLLMQTWRSIYEYFRAVMRAPIPMNEKKVLVFQLLKQGYWQRKEIKDELWEYIKVGTSKR